MKAVDGYHPTVLLNPIFYSHSSQCSNGWLGALLGDILSAECSAGALPGSIAFISMFVLVAITNR